MYSQDRELAQFFKQLDMNSSHSQSDIPFRFPRFRLPSRHVAHDPQNKVIELQELPVVDNSTGRGASTCTSTSSLKPSISCSADLVYYTARNGSKFHLTEGCYSAFDKHSGRPPVWLKHCRFCGHTFLNLIYSPVKENAITTS